MLYALIVFSVVAIVAAFFIYRAVQEDPTCFDGKQNGDERGIDCGGTCANYCEGEAKNLVTIWSRAFPIVGDVYNVTAYVENQNIDAALTELTYRFRLYDENNVYIGDRVGKTFIEPNKRTAIFEGGIAVGNRVPRTVFFDVLAGDEWVKTSTALKEFKLFVPNRELENEDTTPRVRATLENRTLMDIANIEVVAILYGQDGNAVTVSKTFVESIPASSAKEVFFTWPMPLEEDIINIEIIPRINITKPLL